MGLDAPPYQDSAEPPCKACGLPGRANQPLRPFARHASTAASVGSMALAALLGVFFIVMVAIVLFAFPPNKIVEWMSKKDK